jgi:hypothetical protein
MTATLTASPTRLRDGTWGARVTGPAAEGDEITITARSGKTWQAEVVRVLWTGDGVAICSTASIDRPHRTSRPAKPRRAWYDDPDHQCYSCKCHIHGAPFDGCDRCFCDGDM